jgi:hypothetical protein
MKKIGVIGLILSLFFLSLSIWADCKPLNCYNYYVGFESQLRNINIRNHTLRGNFEREALQGNILGGIKFGEDIGLEFGTSVSKSKLLLNRVKARSNHVSFVGEKGIYNNLKLIGGIGLSFLKITAKQGYLTSKSKNSGPRLIAGLHSDIKDFISLRTSVVWEKSENIKSQNINYGNSLIYGIGLLFKF